MANLIKDRLHFLAEASKILSVSLDYHVTLANVAKLITDNFADFCMIDLLDENGVMERVAARVGDPKKIKIANKMFNFPANPRNKGGIYDAARTGTPILTEYASQKWLRGVAKTPEERKTLSELGVKSFIFAPLRSRDRIIGVLSIISSKKDFSYSEDDVILAQEIADRAGIAVDKAQLYLEAQQFLRTREEFMSIAAHELRTPLTIILLHLQKANSDIRKLMQKHTGMEQVLDLLEKSEKQGFRLSKMINDLLDVSLAVNRKIRIEKERLELNDLVEDVIQLFSVQIKNPKNSIVFIKNSKPVIGNWDRIRLEQVISNLISNAVKYGRDKPINVAIKTTGNYALIEVKDRGIGIKSQHRREIFELFKRGMDTQYYKGIGIGLYISDQIVKAHDGNIEVKSKDGAGSTFIVKIPLK